MKRAVRIILVVLLLLSAITYSVGYGYDYLKQDDRYYRNERKVHIAERYQRERDGPRIRDLTNTWNSDAFPRLLQSKDAALRLWTKVLEKVRNE